MNLKPEAKAEIILWDWLTTKGKKAVEKVYFNRKNEISAPVFTTKGINKKPDLLIKINKGYGEEFCAVEVKSSEQSKNIHDARKILDYYKRYIDGETKYFIKEKEINISHFLVATENSKNGFLFQNETHTILNEDSSDSWRKTNSKYQLEPKEEFSLTSMWLRRLWADFRYLRKDFNKEDFTTMPSIGILMNNFYENDEAPHLFIMNFNGHLKNKSWGARFWRL